MSEVTFRLSTALADRYRTERQRPFLLRSVAWLHVFVAISVAPADAQDLEVDHVFVADGTLMAAPFDETTLTLTGDAVALVDGLPVGGLRVTRTSPSTATPRWLQRPGGGLGQRLSHGGEAHINELLGAGGRSLTRS